LLPIGEAFGQRVRFAQLWLVSGQASLTELPGGTPSRATGSAFTRFRRDKTTGLALIVLINKCFRIGLIYLDFPGEYQGKDGVRELIDSVAIGLNRPETAGKLPACPFF